MRTLVSFFFFNPPKKKKKEEDIFPLSKNWSFLFSSDVLPSPAASVWPLPPSPRLSGTAALPSSPSAKSLWWPVLSFMSAVASSAVWCSHVSSTQNTCSLAGDGGWEQIFLRLWLFSASAAAADFRRLLVGVWYVAPETACSHPPVSFTVYYCILEAGKLEILPERPCTCAALWDLCPYQYHRTVNVTH